MTTELIILCMCISDHHVNGLDFNIMLTYRCVYTYNTSGSYCVYRYDHLHDIIFNFINKTGISMLETDGPYGGQTCSSTNHTHHNNYNDSVFQQNCLQTQFYHELKRTNIFINSPDNYFFQGGEKIGMGYNELQYNLPRWEDLTVSRQSMYDDTYYHIPTQGWMQVPLIQYHGGESHEP